jgi:hypothetical protein
MLANDDDSIILVLLTHRFNIIDNILKTLIEYRSAILAESLSLLKMSENGRHSAAGSSVLYGDGK